MPDRAIRYNGRVLAASGLALGIGRNYATTDKTGTSIPAGQPVFDSQAAYLAAPAAPTVVASVTTAGGVVAQALGSGVDVDGTTPVVVTLRTPGSGSYTIGIHVGHTWGANAFDAAANTVRMEGTGNRSVIRSILCEAGDLGGANKSGGNREDLLRGSGVGFGEDANWRYQPLSAIVAHGLVMIWCRAVFWTGVAWEVRASALCAWDDIGGRFYLVTRAANANVGVQRGSIWNNAMWTARGANGQTDRTNRPVDVWTACVDYQNSPLTGTDQVTMLFRATRPNTASRAWTVQGLEFVRRTTTTGNQHDHSAHVYFGSDASVHVVICRGHVGNNAVWRISRASESGWNSGPASTTDGATQNGWTTQATFSGDAAANMAHNQYMSVAPLGGNPFEFLVTQDIGQTPISRMIVPAVAGTSKAVFEPVRVRQALAPNPGYMWENFGLWCQDYNPPRSFTMLLDGQDPGPTMLSPGSGNWGTYAPTQKLCWSPDGLNWGQMFAWTNVRGGRGVPNGPNVIMERITATTTELIQVGIPPMMVGRPLLISPPVTNFADGIITQSGPPDAGNTVTNVTSTYLNPGFVTGRTIPPCPSGRNVYRYTNTGATSNYGGEHFITPSGLTVSGQRLKVKLWVYVLPPAEPWTNNTTAPYNVPRPQLEFRFRYGTGVSTFGSGPSNQDGGGWVPFTIEMDAATWTTQTGRLLMRLQCSSGAARPCDVLISVESVTAGATSEIPLIPPPASTGAAASTIFADHAISTGWNPTANWSFLIALQNSDDGPDMYDLTRPNAGSRRLFTLVQSLGSGQTRTLWATLDLGANDRITFTDGTNTAQLVAPTDQDFEWGRSTQLGIAISRASNGDMVFAAFMGGTIVATTTANWAQDIRPNSVHHADLSQGPVEPHTVHLVRIDEDNARNATDLAAWLRSSAALSTPSSSRGSTIVLE